ncbi:hypothetical protein [Paenibacillus sp. yr247]|uniref:hypothetical protein n=1 Tax=Paenibacillus sp. yr247 TaxID=1761880 RepID=UPI001587F6B7|nr:hypothetical protein [Paenibacillus sp. yr247]
MKESQVTDGAEHIGIFTVSIRDSLMPLRVLQFLRFTEQISIRTEEAERDLIKVTLPAFFPLAD